MKCVDFAIGWWRNCQLVKEGTVSHRKYVLRALYACGLLLLPIGATAQTSTLSLLPGETSPPPLAGTAAGTAAEPTEAQPAAATPAENPESQSPETKPADAPAPAVTPTAEKPQAGDTEQVKITAPKTSGIAAIVNDTVISDYDLDQRTALFVATSGVRPTKETLGQIRTQVLRSLEDEVLELQEANKHKISVAKADVDRALKNIADDNHLTTEQIVATITQAGVSPDIFRQQLAAQLVWQKLVSARYGTDVLISDQQIDEAMDRLKKGADKPQFEVSEIFLAVDRPEDEATVRTSAEEIAKQIKEGAPFTAVAGQFSQSPSAADGGDIGWVIQGQLPEELDHALLDLRPGQIAGPIKAEGGYYIVELRERREPLGTKIEEKPDTPPDPNAPLPLARLLIPVPPTADQAYRDKALQLANNLKPQARTCQDLSNVAKQIPGTVFADLGSTTPKELAPLLRDALEKSHPGEVITPFFSAAGLEIIMRCDPAPPKLVALQLPTRDQLQQQLFVQQMSILGKSYLRDLRRDAVVENR
jgi:peptidyl-prolyl cis-trans isomerase SurA